MVSDFLIGSLQRHLAAISAGDRRRGRPVDKIRKFEKATLCKLLVRQLRRPDFGTRLPEGFFISCPPCVQAGKEGGSTTTKSESDLLVFLLTFFGNIADT